MYSHKSNTVLISNLNHHLYQNNTICSVEQKMLNIFKKDSTWGMLEKNNLHNQLPNNKKNYPFLSDKHPAINENKEKGSTIEIIGPDRVKEKSLNIYSWKEIGEEYRLIPVFGWKIEGDGKIEKLSQKSIMIRANNVFGQTGSFTLIFKYRNKFGEWVELQTKTVKVKSDSYNETVQSMAIQSKNDLLKYLENDFFKEQ